MCIFPALLRYSWWKKLYSKCTTWCFDILYMVKCLPQSSQLTHPSPHRNMIILCVLRIIKISLSKFQVNYGVLLTAAAMLHIRSLGISILPHWNLARFWPPSPYFPHPLSPWQPPLFAFLSSTFLESTCNWDHALNGYLIQSLLKWETGFFFIASLSVMLPTHGLVRKVHIGPAHTPLGMTSLRTASRWSHSVFAITLGEMYCIHIEQMRK